jgi:hypothetical protein
VIVLLFAAFGSVTAIGHGEQVLPVSDGAPNFVNNTNVSLSEPLPGQWSERAGQFSPFDDTFRKYAGDEAGNDELISIIAAATKRESRWNSETTGDDGHSVGLFQIHDVHGLSRTERADPDAAAAFMVPRFSQAYKQVKATRPSLSGAALASTVVGMAQRPSDWTDPASPARMKYREAHVEVMTDALRRAPHAKPSEL